MNKNLLTKLIILLAVFFAGLKAFTQAPDFTEVNKKFNFQREQVLQEKVYAHLDKPSYLAGEILWFKIYNVDASLHKLLDISKVVYVEILDKEHNAILQTKVSLKAGTEIGRASCRERVSHTV